MSFTSGILLSALLGAIFGSFITMASYRMPRSLSLMGRSSCPQCHTNLGIFDLVPIFSYIFLRGNCRYCHTSISVRYTAIEFVTASIFALNFLILGHDIVLLAIVNLICVNLLIMTCSDLETMVITDSMFYPLVVLATIYTFYNSHPLLNLVVFPLFIYATIWLVSKLVKLRSAHDTIGSADLKLFAIGSMMLVIENIAAFILMSGLFGLLFGLYWRVNRKGVHFPFAPSIATSLYFCILFGAKLDFNLLVNAQ